MGSMIAAFILFGVVAYLIRRRLRKRRADNGIWDKAQLHGDSLTAKPHRQAKKDPNSTTGEICELPVSPGITELQQTPETRWHELDATADQGEKGDRSQYMIVRLGVLMVIHLVTWKRGSTRLGDKLARQWQQTR